MYTPSCAGPNPPEIEREGVVGIFGARYLGKPNGAVGVTERLGVATFAAAIVLGVQATPDLWS